MLTPQQDLCLSPEDKELLAAMVDLMTEKEWEPERLLWEMRNIAYEQEVARRAEESSPKEENVQRIMTEAEAEARGFELELIHYGDMAARGSFCWFVSRTGCAYGPEFPTREAALAWLTADDGAWGRERR